LNLDASRQVYPAARDERRTAPAEPGERATRFSGTTSAECSSFLTQS
jgi:hypothetical protein